VAALDVLPLAQAKDHLNIPASNVDNDAELTREIGVAVERVQRHIGRVLVDQASSSASEIFACKVALAYFWVTMRPENAPPPGYMTGGNDDTPAYFVPLSKRLAEILGGESGGATSAPTGAFDDPPAWPDPPRATGTYQTVIVWR
jgi:hypothetical protein